MTERIVYTCDVCGDESESPRVLTIATFDDMQIMRKDLCSECAKEFIDHVAFVTSDKPTHPDEY